MAKNAKSTSTKVSRVLTIPISVTGITWRNCEGLFCVGGAPDTGGTDVFDAKYSNVGPI